MMGSIILFAGVATLFQKDAANEASAVEAVKRPDVDTKAKKKIEVLKPNFT